MPSSQAHLQLQKTLASPKVQIPQTGLRSLHSSSRSKTSLLFALLTSLNIPRWRPALLPSCPPVLSRSFFPFIPPSPPLRPEFPRPLAEERGGKKKRSAVERQLRSHATLGVIPCIGHPAQPLRCPPAPRRTQSDLAARKIPPNARRSLGRCSIICTKARPDLI